MTTYHRAVKRSYPKPMAPLKMNPLIKGLLVSSYAKSKGFTKSTPYTYAPSPVYGLRAVKRMVSKPKYGLARVQMNRPRMAQKRMQINRAR